jgi:hypothetical protein
MRDAIPPPGRVQGEGSGGGAAGRSYPPMEADGEPLRRGERPGGGAADYADNRTGTGNAFRGCLSMLGSPRGGSR